MSGESVFGRDKMMEHVALSAQMFDIPSSRTYTRNDLPEISFCKPPAAAAITLFCCAKRRVLRHLFSLL